MSMFQYSYSSILLISIFYFLDFKHFFTYYKISLHVFIGLTIIFSTNLIAGQQIITTTNFMPAPFSRELSVQS